MTPHVDLSALTKCKAWEYALRFVFGGVVTVAAALVLHRWGAVVGGLFLGFPAILPASLTLVKEHDGRAKADDDARGGRLGACGLALFAVVVWQGTGRLGIAASLALATLAWLVVSASAWWALHRHESN